MLEAMKLSRLLWLFCPALSLYGNCEDPCKPLYFYNCDCIEVTPEAGPQVRRSWNLFTTASFIYWTVREDGLIHAASGVSRNATEGSIHDLNWGMDAGFQVGLGLNIPHDGWDVFLEYTWINANARDSVSKDRTTSDLVSYWSGNGIPNETLSFSKAVWDLHFKSLCLSLGRNSYLSQFFKMRIHAGLQGAWINQDYEVTQTVAFNRSTNRLSLKQDFWGMGLRAGLDTAWQFNHNFSLFADFALAILWGQFEVSRRDRNIRNDVDTTNLFISGQPHTFEPTLALDAGLRWEMWFSDDRFHILLQAGWDNQMWVLQNEFIKVPTETDHIGDLVLQGLTIKARFDF